MNIRRRLRSAGAALARAPRAGAARASAVIGVDEFFFLLALAGLTAGLWPRFGQETLVLPSAVLLWVYLPQRVPFVVRTPPQKGNPG